MKRRLTALFLCVIMCVLSMFTLSACKKKTFTVTFDRGGTSSMNITVMEGFEDIPEVQTVSHWSEIVFPVYICKGYTFSAWNQIISRIDKDTVITAQWTPHPFIVKFDAVNPEAVLKSDVSLLEQTIHNWTEVITPKFELTGYSVEWEWDVRNTKDTTVYAKWTPNVYSLDFVDSNGTSYNFEPVSVTYNEPVGALPVPVKENMRFGGWYVQGNVSEYVIEGSIWKKARDTTLVSRWLEEEQYKITYVNAYEIKGDISYRATDEDFVINTPIRYGYDFLGWTGTGIGNEPQKEVLIEKGTTGDLEFTAHWRAKSRSLTLDADGGEITQMSKSVTFGEKIGELPTNVVREGYEFIGWETENGAMVDENTVWSWDPDQTTFIKAVYKRLYTIKLVLKCPSSKTVCSVSNAVASELGLIKSETEENVWVFDRLFKEGERVGNLPDDKGVSFDKNEYSFSHWATNTGIKVNSSDIINEKKFPGTKEVGEIYIYVKLSYNWTPFY